MNTAGMRLLTDLSRASRDPPIQLPKWNSEHTTKSSWHQPIPLPPHRIMVVSERNLRSGTFTPLLRRRPTYGIPAASSVLVPATVIRESASCLIAFDFGFAVIAKLNLRAVLAVTERVCVPLSTSQSREVATMNIQVH